MIFLLAGKGEVNTLSNSEEKNSLSYLTQHFTSSAHPLEKLKTWIQGAFWHSWPPSIVVGQILSVCSWIFAAASSGISSHVGHCRRGRVAVPPCKHNLASLGVFKERYQRLTGGLVGNQDIGNRGRGRRSVIQKELMTKPKRWDLWSNCFLCVGAGTPWLRHCSGLLWHGPPLLPLLVSCCLQQGSAGTWFAGKCSCKHWESGEGEP